MPCRRSGQRQVANCETCGAEFTRKKSVAGRYCSKQCNRGRVAKESNWLTKTCPGCNEQFRTPKYKETEHCSRACRTLATTVTKNCPTCGKAFTFHKSWPRVHCSNVCYGLASRSEGEGRKYYGANWVKQRLAAIERDGGSCTGCDETENLHVHHIKSLRSFNGDWQAANELDNLVTVCPPHHLEIHGGRYDTYETAY